MDFYSTVFISFIIILIVTLAIVGTILSNMNKKQKFPSNISTCPDYYSLNEQGVCLQNGAIFNDQSVTCKIFRPDDPQYKIKGTGETSGMCKKKQWGNQCGVSWDGITNDMNICF
jgi:hypothetical protein